MLMKTRDIAHTNRMPQTGEGLHSENLSSGLKNRPEDLPVKPASVGNTNLAGTTEWNPAQHESLLEKNLPKEVSHKELVEDSLRISGHGPGGEALGGGRK
jgi:hypothetical protein